VKSLATAPLHWKKAQWTRFGEGLGLIAIVMAADKPIEDAFQRNRSSSTNSFAKAVTPFGGGRGLEVSALLFGAGKLFHDANVEDAGRDALESDLLAGGIVTPLLKDLFGRARPNINEGTYNFHFIRTDNPHNSFPSGHATSAFALATAIAGHYVARERSCSLAGGCRRRCADRAGGGEGNRGATPGHRAGEARRQRADTLSAHAVRLLRDRRRPRTGAHHRAGRSRTLHPRHQSVR
ncbi:MAG: hypothetical protein DMF58_16770, partial [Acidobacteria bacterium]